MTKKSKVIKRIDPNKPKIPAKDFKLQQKKWEQVVDADLNLNDFLNYTRYLDGYQSAERKLLEKVIDYQQRALDIVNQEYDKLDAEQEREYNKQLLEQENDHRREILDNRDQIPKDIMKKILIDHEKFDDTSIDTNPKQPIVTRQLHLKDIASKKSKK